MNAIGLKAVGALAAVAALLGSGALASADSSPTCTLTFTSPSPFSPVTTGTPVHYAGSLSISGGANYTITKVVIDAQGAGHTPPVTEETLAGLMVSGPGPVTLTPFSVTWPGTGNAQIEAHVYMTTGNAEDETVVTTHCHESLVVTTRTNELPEVPWSAGLPLLLGAGALIALRRRSQPSSPSGPQAGTK